MQRAVGLGGLKTSKLQVLKNVSGVLKPVSALACCMKVMLTWGLCWHFTTHGFVVCPVFINVQGLWLHMW